MTQDSDEGNIKNPQSLNPYLYTANNPVSRIDPTGDDWIDVALAGVSFGAGVVGVGAVVSAVMASAPVSVPVLGSALLVSGGAAFFSTYRNRKKLRQGEMSRGEFYVSSGLSVFGVVDPAFALGSLAWETVSTLYQNKKRAPRHKYRKLWCYRG